MIAPADRAMGRILLLLLTATVGFALYTSYGAYFLDGFVLDLGSLTLPAPRQMAWLYAWTILGLPIAVCLGLAGAGLLRRAQGGERLLTVFQRGPDAPWVLGGSLLVLVATATIRALLLRGAPLTDDESAYRFSAELLASGRLWVPSHDMKLFFDQLFMINDGRFRPYYFLGWPALMVPGVWLGIDGAINSLYSALTVPPLYFILRRTAGPAWARAGLVLYLGSPFLLIGSATGLSHTTCTMALACLAWLVLRSRDQGSPTWTHAAVAAFFSLAFFIRPQSALGAGLPFLLVWAAGLRPLASGPRRRALLAFALPALLGASLFFHLNKALFGGYFTTGYHAAIAYIVANHAGFDPAAAASLVPGFDVGLASGAAKTAVALLRENFAFFGWPLSFLFLPWAWSHRGARPFWASFFLLHAFLFFAVDSGIDSFGPVHFYEAVLPAIVLTVCGLQRASDFLAQRVAGRAEALCPPHWLPAAVFSGCIVASLLGYFPVAFATVAGIARSVRAPEEMVRAAGLHDAVVFVYGSFSPDCVSRVTRHFVVFRPNSDPDLRNDVLWVNHLSLAADGELMKRHFPGRRGFIFGYDKSCEPLLLPLDRVEPGALREPEF